MQLSGGWPVSNRASLFANYMGGSRWVLEIPERKLKLSLGWCEKSRLIEAGDKEMTQGNSVLQCTYWFGPACMVCPLAPLPGEIPIRAAEVLTTQQWLIIRPHKKINGFASPACITLWKRNSFVFIPLKLSLLACILFDSKPSVLTIKGAFEWA